MLPLVSFFCSLVNPRVSRALLAHSITGSVTGAKPVVHGDVHFQPFSTHFLGRQLELFVGTAHPLSLGFGGGGRKMVTYNKRGGGGVKNCKLHFFWPQKSRGGRGG